MDEAIFKELHQNLKLSHHPFKRSMLYLKWAFKNIDFKGARVLDIGGGNGIYSYFAKFQGADYCLNLEPFAAGSDNISVVATEIPSALEIETKKLTLQEFETDAKFDVIILHDSINHLNEEVFGEIHRDKSLFNIYSSLVSKIRALTSSQGIVLVADCSRVNFYAALGITNPSAPTIEWHIHQHTDTIIELFEKNGFKLDRLRWSPFKRFDRFGQLLSKLGFPVSYFMQSHFNLVFTAV